MSTQDDLTAAHNAVSVLGLDIAELEAQRDVLTQNVTDLQDELDQAYLLIQDLQRQLDDCNQTPPPPPDVDYSLRAFTADSWWNTPLGNAGVDSTSAQYISWLKTNANTSFMALSLGNWAMPVYYSTASDPLVTINPTGNGPTVTFRLPADAQPMAGNDAAISIVDVTTNQDIQLFEFNPAGPSATGVARYWLDSNGIPENPWGGAAGNDGHRGIPGFTHSVHLNEVQSGVIARRLKIAVPGPSEPPGGSPVYPMNGFEKGKGNGPFEGLILRIKPSVDLAARGLPGQALIIATALQDYGAVVGDTSGATVVLKMQKNATWNVTRSGLNALTWDDYEFVQRGWGQ
jgi:hypothetical protein